MIQVIRAEREQDKATAFGIREQVFVVEQQVPREAENDAFEQTATHYVATCDAIPCGAARWRVTDQGIKLERFAVLREYRNRQVGAALLQAVLQDVKATHAHSKVYLNAQLPAVNFYKRHGFVTEGDMFTECDIQHYKMVYAG
jgi:predicted GNAT family N-acyltransferase